MTLLNKSYESLGVIASALYGDVYKLRHRTTGELVALKHMDLAAAARRRTKDTNRPIEEDVFAEVQTNLALRKLGGHPYIVAMHDCVSDDHSVSLFTEFCGQGELLQVVNKRATLLSVGDALRYFYQIVQGMAFLHSHGIAHRDLSLENVLVDDNDCCKISDFGMASRSTRQRATGIGKVHYMAPEACRDLDHGETYYNPFEADMWSLGVILLTMLTGQYPFEHALESDAHFRLLANFGVEYVMERCDFETHGYEAIVDLLSRLLVVDPALRATAEELLAHECFDMFLPSDEAEEDEQDEEVEDEEEENNQIDQMDAPVMESETDSVMSEDEHDINPAEDGGDEEECLEKEVAVSSLVPARPYMSGGGVAGLFVYRRPATIDTSVGSTTTAGINTRCKSTSRACCTFVVSSRKSPVVLKEERAAAADLSRATRPSSSPRFSAQRTTPTRRSPKGKGTKKCVFRGMLDGVFRRKKARTTTHLPSTATPAPHPVA